MCPAGYGRFNNTAQTSSSLSDLCSFDFAFSFPIQNCFHLSQFSPWHCQTSKREIRNSIMKFIESRSKPNQMKANQAKPNQIKSNQVKTKQNRIRQSKRKQNEPSRTEETDMNQIMNQIFSCMSTECDRNILLLHEIHHRTGLSHEMIWIELIKLKSFLPKYCQIFAVIKDYDNHEDHMIHSKMCSFPFHISSNSSKQRNLVGKSKF